jgi:DivIVA domain-containing protein
MSTFSFPSDAVPPSGSPPHRIPPKKSPIPHLTSTGPAFSFSSQSAPDVNESNVHFKVGLRGYRTSSVDFFLKRIAKARTDGVAALRASEIRTHVFPRSVKGYRCSEVDAFLETIAQSWIQP